jgi:pyroglutamyl-peptidase
VASGGRDRPILLTGFAPFGGDALNPSAQVATALDGADVCGRVVADVLPVARAGVAERLPRLFKEVDPALVLLLGLANGRPAPAVERVALNVLDFPITDNDGVQPVDEPVVPGGPAAYLASVPVKAILAAWREARLPGYVSNTAGTYMCNATFYLASHLGASRAVPVGLVHLPYLPEQAGRDGVAPAPSMALDMQVECVRMALRAAATHVGPDLSIAAGMVS